MAVLAYSDEFDRYQIREIILDNKLISKQIPKKIGHLKECCDTIYNERIQPVISMSCFCRRKNMDVTYNKLFKMLIDKELTKTEFAKQVGISTNTLAKLSRNEFVSMDILVRICRKLNCSVDDMMEILPETRERS